MKQVLLAMAVYSTEENKKDDCLERTLQSLSKTVDFSVHKLMLSVNSETERTKNIIGLYEQMGVIDHVIWNPTNIGTAYGINKIWSKRQSGQHCVKMDDDVVIEDDGWLDQLVECINRDPNIGICSLKRLDCWENTQHPDPYYRSELIQLHKPGHRHLIVEKCMHTMGTVQLYNSAFLDKIGGLYQAGARYGYDDVLACWRAFAANYKCVFLPHIVIHHIDPGNTEYQGWKERHSGKYTQLVIDIKNQYLRGERSIYFDVNSQEGLDDGNL